MSNRSYLYSLSNRPTSYRDRPETISGLSEWPYFVPFTYRLLMSGDPQLCASLISDGFEEESPHEKSRIYAISSDFETGFGRLTRFFDVLRSGAVGISPRLAGQLVESVNFVEAHRDGFLLLETIELDTMAEEGEAELRACVEAEIAVCRQAGEAVDALPADPTEAGTLLKAAVTRKCKPPLDAFHGLRLDDDCDNVSGSKTEYPLGLEWSDVLYFELWNRAQFEANL